MQGTCSGPGSTWAFRFRDGSQEAAEPWATGGQTSLDSLAEQALEEKTFGTDSGEEEEEGVAEEILAEEVEELAWLAW